MERAVVLDGAMTVASAHERVSAYPRETLVAIRDHTQNAIQWWVSVVSEIASLDRSETPLREALGLATRDTARVAQIARSPRKSANPAVVLDGTEFVGVIRPTPTETSVERYRPWHPGLPGPKRDEYPILAGEEGRWIRMQTSAEEEAVPVGVGAAPERVIAWPSLRAPSSVAPGQSIFVEIVLADRSPGTDQPPINVALDPGMDSVEVDVHLAARGFDAPAGWRHTIEITPGKPVPPLYIELIARHDLDSELALIHAAFLHRGVLCGNAVAGITIGSAIPPPPIPLPPAMKMPEPEEAPADLTLLLTKSDGNSSTGLYLWTMTSPHADVDATPFEIDLGNDPQTFARTLISRVTANENSELLDLTLNGLADRIAEHLHVNFVAALHAVAKAIGRTPGVLIYSAEPFIPWELARLDPPLDAAVPPFLAAQAVVGRWVHSQTGRIAPPAAVLKTADFVVLAGDYASSNNFRALPHALEEADYVVATHSAIRMEATARDVARLLNGNAKRADGSPATVRIVHFACHGAVDPMDPQYAAIYLAEDTPLTPDVLRAAPLGRNYSPLLFLNACQVGTSATLLGDYAGFASDALRGGFGAFIAPLWSVDDEVARDIAKQFYDDALPHGGQPGRPLAEILRDVRRSYVSSSDTPHSTFLAYVFYGHPGLRLMQS